MPNKPAPHDQTLQNELNQWLAEHCPELTAEIRNSVVIFHHFASTIHFHAPRVIFDGMVDFRWACACAVAAYSAGKLRGVEMACEVIKSGPEVRPLDSLSPELKKPLIS